MREIIYIQAGSLSNYIGTHFWNTQESYFAYGDDEPTTSYDTSFREGLTSQGDPILCPRLLLFDHKANFGTLAANNALFEKTQNEDGRPLWDGDTVEYAQDPIPKSKYQTQMEEESEVDDSSDQIPGSNTEEIRYWSDFNRVYYMPRTLQKIPDVADWENTDGDWNSGQETFERYNEDTGLMEGPLRLFLEECDSVQGIQITDDTSTFGSFINSLLTSFHDEFVKLPALVFPVLSAARPSNIDVGDDRGMRKCVNDALCLRSLNEMASMTTPLQSPSTWSHWWYQDLDLEQSSNYHTSSILSAHIETSTLPLRLRGTSENIASFSSQLDWRGSTHFSQLNGVFPAMSSVDFDRDTFNFSAIRLAKIQPVANQKASQFARRDVSRGFSLPNISNYNDWRELSSLQDSFIVSLHAPAYPLPTSFPSFLKAPGSNTSGRPGVLSSDTSMFSSVGTTAETADMFSMYATFVEDIVKHRSGIDAIIGMDLDDLKDLGNDLWTIHDNYTDGADETLGIAGEDTFGEDET